MLTDAPGPANAVYIEPTGPRPMDGTVIRWGPHHVWWEDRIGQQQRVGKVGLEFDWRDPGVAYSCPVDRPIDPVAGG